MLLLSIMCVVSCKPSKDGSESTVDSLDVGKNEVEIPKDTNTLRTPSVGRCDIDIVRFTDNMIDSLNLENIHTFLATFDPACGNNVEFGEYSNEVLFEVLVRYPDLFSKALHMDSVQLDTIMNELSNPVANMEESQIVIEKIWLLDITMKQKEEIVTSFKSSLGLK